MTSLHNSEMRVFTEAGETQQLTAYYEPGRKAVWLMMRPEPRPSFNPVLIADVEAVFKAIRSCDTPVEYFISGCTLPGMYNTGGDLSLFAQAIRHRNHEALLDYARRCIDILVDLDGGFGRDVITIALVEGVAMGGGFEAALAHHYLLAQNDARMGFPEISFNLFPGMGAYSFVGRKGGQRVAEHLISTGEIHLATWHKEEGLVNQLFEPGAGPEAARKLMDSLRPRLNGIRAMLRARHRVFPVTREELLDVTTDWVESALCVEEKDVAYMERLVRLQSHRSRR